MLKKIQRNFVAEMIIAGVLMLLMSAFAAWSIRQITKSAHHQEISNALQNQIDTILEDVQYADNSHLKFLITSHEVYRRNYVEFRNKALADLSEFYQAGSTREDFKNKYRELEVLVREYFDRADENIKDKLENPNYRAEDAGHELSGDLLRQIFRITDIVNSRENTAFALHGMSIMQYSNWSVLGILLGSLLSFVFLVYSAYSIRAETRNRMEIGEDLRVAQQSADRASRMRNQFYAVISHELRTPLNGIIGISEVLSEKLTNEEQHRYLKIIQESGNSLLKMVNDLLNISKIESGKLELEIKEFALPEIIEQTTNLVSLRAKEKGLFLKTHMDERLARRYFGDGERIKQILVNLLTNSIKYTHTGGIYFRTKLKQDIGTSQSVLRFEVEDTGVGIKESDRALVFAPFQQIKGNGVHSEGFGLGLSIVKNLVELMRGEMNFESTLGRGTLFWIEIPLRVAGEWRQASEAQGLAERGVTFQEVGSTSVAANISKRVLVAEDNPTNQILIETFLKKLGFEFKMVGNGVECLRALEEESFDLVLMDCGMPILDGYEATQKIRQREAAGKVALPIVALTAHAMEEEKQKCLSVGMTDYLSKPFTFNDFKKVLEKYLGVSRDMNIYQSLVDETSEALGQEMLRSFQETLSKALAGIGDALVDGNHGQVKYWCHLIRSSAKTLGFVNIATLAEKIEKSIVAGSMHSPDVIQLTLEVRFALSMLKMELSSDNPHPSPFQS
jgi:signal transduction histidine kinase/CheY-like chemotaxis protein/HPt (histidine-containing phosphotransfer) domain-containing protein